MKVLLLIVLIAASCLASPLYSSLLRRQLNNTRPNDYSPNYFDQLIDHFPNSDRYLPHTNSTFKQRYFLDSSYYKPGGPVFLLLSGETSGTSRFRYLETGIIQILMNATNGLGVILENRYYGQSYPFNSSTTDELRFLTTEQTIADNAYFAQHVSFPEFSDDLTAQNTPWILYGGSLAGAQTAFSLVEYSGLLWGGIGSSAVIHVNLTYPEWYKPIQKYGPQDCISRINKIVDKIDSLIFSGNRAAVQQLKDIFGLGALEDDRDFAMTIAFPLGGPMWYPTNTWQELNWWPAYDSPDFFWFCDNITTVEGPDRVTAVDSALAEYTNGEPWTGLGNYAQYIKDSILPSCASPALVGTTTCFGTQNESYWADSMNSQLRSYLYSTCTEQGLYQVAPSSGPSLISQVIQGDYTQQWCVWGFPPGSSNSIPETPDLTWYTRYGDFDLQAPRLALIDGDVDVWKDVCYHSDDAPQRYGDNQYLIAGAGHHWDSAGILDLQAEPDYIRAAHEWEIRRVKAWLKEWMDGGSKDEL